MSYRIEQKINGHVYFYNVTKEWDPVKKKSIQKREYLGKKDPATGKIIPPSYQRPDLRAKWSSKQPNTPPTTNATVLASSINQPSQQTELGATSAPLSQSHINTSGAVEVNKVQVTELGHLHLLQTIAKETNLIDALKQVFGEQASALLSLSYYQLLEAKAFHLYELWQSNGYSGVLDKLPSQRISELLSAIGHRQDLIQAFFQVFASKQIPTKGAWLDITSISSYSRLDNWAEWGYNRDDENLPQINLGVVMGYPVCLPLYYQIYPGSIVDVTTLKNVIAQTKALNIPINTWIMDKGFFSKANIQYLIDQKCSFITTIPLWLKESKRMLDSTKDCFNSLVNSFNTEKDVYTYHCTTAKVQDPLTKAENSLHGWIYMNHSYRNQEIHNFTKNMKSVEQAALNMRFVNEKDVHDWLIAQHVDVYDISLKDQKLTLIRNDNALQKKVNHMGKFILLTDRTDLSAEELLIQYREKDRVEKVFDALKNTIRQDRLRTHGAGTSAGKMFICFLSLIIHTALTNRWRATDRLKKYNMSEVFMELKKIKRLEYADGKTVWTEITKKQRIIFESLGISLPGVIKSGI